MPTLTRKPLVIIAGQQQELPVGDQLDISTIASGTPDGTQFVRDDGTLAVPPGGEGGSVSPGLIAFLAANG